MNFTVPKSVLQNMGCTVAKRVGDTIMAVCTDCQRPLTAREEYIVRAPIWLESGMGNWDAGYLHLECLSKRLGREITDDDLLVWYEDETRSTIQMGMHPDYLTTPMCHPPEEL